MKSEQRPLEAGHLNRDLGGLSAHRIVPGPIAEGATKGMAADGLVKPCGRQQTKLWDAYRS